MYDWRFLIFNCRVDRAQNGAMGASILLLDVKAPKAIDMNIPTEQPMKSRGERVLASLRKPKLRLVRIPAGVLLVLGGVVGFLPLVGFWMVPLGLAVLAIDFPIADRLLRKLRNLSCKLRRFYLRRNGPPCSRK
jgi:putative transmembrane protein PGPGW